MAGRLCRNPRAGENAGAVNAADAPIVVAYDGSADSDRALEWAITAAAQRLCPLRLVTVVTYDAPQWLRERAEEAERRAVERLSELGGQSGRLPVALVKTFVDPAAHALLLQAADARMLVLGARGHGAISGYLLGSVSQHLSRHAGCPVVVVRQSHDAKDTRIVIGYDHSTGSQQAVEFGFEAANLAGAPVTVIHGSRRGTHEPAGTYVSMSQEEVANETDSGARRMREAMGEWQAKYPDLDVTLESVPLHPVRLLTDASQHATLVVVGSRGRGAFAGLLLGSVSQGLLHHAACTVAIAR